MPPRAPSRRFAQEDARIRAFFSGGAGLLGACSHFSEHAPSRTYRKSDVVGRGQILTRPQALRAAFLDPSPSVSGWNGPWCAGVRGHRRIDGARAGLLMSDKACRTSYAPLKTPRNEASPQTAESKPAAVPRESSLLDGRSAAAKIASKTDMAKLASFRQNTGLEDV